MCDVCNEREALFRLLVWKPRRCFGCVADDPSLPEGHRYKEAIEERLTDRY
jgi:hypothetical protein